MSLKSIINGVEQVIPIPAPEVQVLDLNGNYENNDLENVLKEIHSNKTNILNANLDSTGYGIISGSTVSAQSTPNMTVNIASGVVHMPSGIRLENAGNSALMITTSDTTNPRKDIVYVNTDNTIGYLAGTPSATPTAPNIPAEAFLLAEINVLANATSITNVNITDKRKIKNTTDNLSTQLSESMQQIADTNKQFNPDVYDGCIVTFIDDDGKLTTQNVFKPIADTKGIKFCSAIVKTWVGTDGYMTIDQIKALQDESHDILNHTNAHVNNWTDYTEEQIINEITYNKNYMIANELERYDVVVYPGTVPNTSLNKNATRKVARYGISNVYNATNDVLDNYYMPRIDSDYHTLTELEAILDTAIENKQWLIILSHSWRPDGDVNSTGTFSVEKISQFIDYIKSKNVPIMTFTEAEKYKGNLASVGTYGDSSSVYISKDGKSNISDSNVVFVTDNTLYTFNNLITDFKADCWTYIPISTTNDTLTSSGGIYQVFRSRVKNFSYATFSPYNSNKIYRRQWNEINSANTWTSWEEITTGNLKVNPNTSNSILMDSNISNYDVDKETVVIIKTAYDTLLGIGGVMRVFRSSQSNFSYATFTPWNSRSMYMRKWRENSYWGTGISTSNASWSDWRKIGTQSGTTVNRPTYVDVGYNYFDTTLGKPIWYNGTNWVDATGTIV